MPTDYLDDTYNTMFSAATAMRLATPDCSWIAPRLTFRPGACHDTVLTWFYGRRTLTLDLHEPFTALNLRHAYLWLLTAEWHGEGWNRPYSSKISLTPPK